MPESRSPEWAHVREPESTFFEAEFDAPSDVKKAVLQIKTFGSESEKNPVYLNGKKIGGLCKALDKDGWKMCEIVIDSVNLWVTNTVKIDTYGGDRDDLMIEGVYFIWE